MSILDAIKEKTGYDLTTNRKRNYKNMLDLKMEIDDTIGKGKLIDEIFGEFCEVRFIRPVYYRLSVEIGRNKNAP